MTLKFNFTAGSLHLFLSFPLCTCMHTLEMLDRGELDSFERRTRNKAYDISQTLDETPGKQDIHSRRVQMDFPLLKMLPCDPIYLNLPACHANAATLFRNQFPRKIEYRRNGASSERIDHRRPSGTTWPLLGNASSNISLFIIQLDDL